MRLHRPSRTSIHPVVQFLLSIVSIWGWLIGTVSLIGLYMWVFSIASNSFDSNPTKSLSRLDCKAQRPSVRLFPSSSSSSSIPPLVPHYEAQTVCSEALSRVKSGEWVDPNDGRIFARQVETFPQFYISLHNESFDPVRWRIMTEGKYYEQHVYDRFLQILSSPNTTKTTSTSKRKTIILDVGANIGYYTLLSAALGYTVVAFEPNPANLLRLCESIRLNGWMQPFSSSIDDGVKAGGLLQIYLLQQAVGEEHGSDLMLYTPRNPGMGYLREIGVRGSDTNTTLHQAKTRMIRLDNFAEENGWLKKKKHDDDDGFQIDILKIDVEGKEPQVALGARKLLSSGLVKHVLTEGRRFGRRNVLDSFILLFDAGFQLNDPIIPNLQELETSREKGKAIQAYYHQTLGANSQVVTDLWWTKR